MQSKMKWFAGVTLAGGLVVGSIVATGVSAQTTTPSGSTGPGFGSGHGMMGGFGPRTQTATPQSPGAGSGVMGGGFGANGGGQAAIANALGITSQQLWDARAAGKSVADLAKDKNVDLSKVVDAVLAAHTTQLNAAVTDGSLTQVQADAMQALMKSRIESRFQANTAGGPWGPGMMGGYGMAGGRGFGLGGRGTR